MEKLSVRTDPLRSRDSAERNFKGESLPQRGRYGRLSERLPEQAAAVEQRLPGFLASIGFNFMPSPPPSPAPRPVRSYETPPYIPAARHTNMAELAEANFTEIKMGGLNYEPGRADGWVFHRQWTGDGITPVASPAINYSHPALKFK